MTKAIWKLKKLKKDVNPKEMVVEVYHRGTFVGGEQNRPRTMTLPPLGWQPWREEREAK
jgi:hypothetical protein